MKTFVIATLWFSLNASWAEGSIQDELMGLRLENLKSAMNARDYDLALHRIRQIDVLDRACRRETTHKKVPFSCFELREEQSAVNVAAKRRIFELASPSALNIQCVEALNVSALPVVSNPLRESKLTVECRSLYRKKAAIELYKQTGRRIE